MLATLKKDTVRMSVEIKPTTIIKVFDILLNS
jgi:hypothetical protein